VAKVIGLDPIDIVPGPDAHHVDPVIHGGADIPHDISVLADSTKDTAHDDLPSACRRYIPPPIRAFRQPIDRPPSMTSSVPVTWRLSSLASHRMPLAISSGAAL